MKKSLQTTEMYSMLWKIGQTFGNHPQPLASQTAIILTPVGKLQVHKAKDHYQVICMGNWIADIQITRHKWFSLQGIINCVRRIEAIEQKKFAEGYVKGASKN